MSDLPIKKGKRGRKTKKELELQKTINKKKEETDDFTEEEKIEETSEIENYILNTDYNEEIQNEEEPNLKNQLKKRGRKPKGGKIIHNLINTDTNKETKPNVILHLKCSLKDLQKQTFENMEPFSFSSNKNDLGFELLNNNDMEDNTKPSYNLSQDNLENKNTLYFKNLHKDNEEEYNEIDEDEDKNAFVKEIWKKLKQLEQKLHLNKVGDKKSACFWCTHDFDNPPIHIPKYNIKETYHVYGCFCSPECATAFLMGENIDSSTKFERYHLMNHIYSKIYNYTKNIKPSPSPYYMLNKYYGNLTIQEYRSLLKNDRLFLIVDKPLTRILPELHEDNEDFIINNKIIPSNNFQIKKKIQRKPLTKSTILNEKFGITA